MFIALGVLMPRAAHAAPVVLDFDALSEFDSVTTQFAGVVFSHATVLTAGSSLNELEFPPLSGVNAIFDDGGPLRIDFAAPVSTFSGFFTYLTAVTLVAYDDSGNILDSLVSSFQTNLWLSGDAGTHPNEQLQLSSALGIWSIVALGDPAGGSFVLDDASYESATPINPVPEPATVSLFAVGAFGMLATLSKKSRRA